MPLEKIVGSQCASSGIPVAFQWSPRWFQWCKLTLVRHWNTTGCQHQPVWFQWYPSVIVAPVVFQCVPIMQKHWIATGIPLGVSISQCGYSGIPVYLWLQWSSSVVYRVVSQCSDRIWFGGHQVRSLHSMQPVMYTTGMVRVVWAKLISFDLQPQKHNNYNGAHIKAMQRVMLKYSHVLRTELASIAEQ